MIKLELYGNSDKVVQLKKQTAEKWLITITSLGLMTWLIAWWINRNTSNLLEEIELLLYFGVAVMTPLAMRLVLQAECDGAISTIYRLGIQFHPLAIIAAGGALLLETEPLATVFACIWQIQTLLLATYGLQRLLPRPTFSLEEVCIDAGFIYFPISGIWLIAYTSGYSLLTFDKIAILLTAVHFTFISPGALVLIGMAGRNLHRTNSWRLYRLIALLAVISPLLVALGITVTQISGFLWVEAFAVIVLAGSFLTLTIVIVSGGLPQQITARMLLMISLSALLITMTFALAYSIGRLTNWWIIRLDQMVQWHGRLNALGFTFLGLVAWNIETPKQHGTTPNIPFSRLPWRWHIGPDFLKRIGAVDNAASPYPTGIIDRLSDYERIDFPTASIDETVARFYEETASHGLLVYPEWQPGFRFLTRIYKRISRRLGQMNFPSRPESEETRISSEIIPLRDELDGRDQVRGWIRTYSETGQAVYVAAYSSHCSADCRYMNIAFPLPFGSLTSILRLETPAERDGGIFLTSYSKQNEDQGVYFANRHIAIRLPINETIRMYPPGRKYTDYPTDFPVGELLANHKMCLFGFHFLTLHYSITYNPKL